MKQLLLYTFLMAACNVARAQIKCPEFKTFTELRFQAMNQDTIYYHEFDKRLIDSAFLFQFRNELDYLLINYSSFGNTDRDTTVSFKRSFQITISEPRVNKLLCKLYEGFSGIGEKRIVTRAQLLEISSQIFYADSTQKRICLRVDGAYPLENPFIEAFCVSTILLHLAHESDFPSYYQDFLESEDMPSFQERIKTNKELEKVLINRYQTLKPKLTFEIK